MNVFGDPEKLTLVFDHHGFVGTLEETAYALIFFVKVHRVTGGE